jgi:uncharacterized protein
VTTTFLPPDAIRDGHLALLTTLREFMDDLRPGFDPGSDSGSLRATLAFLRESLLGFAAREEAAITGSSGSEHTAFEHAFLAVEIDALGREASRLIASDAGSRGAALERVRRRLHRLEAVLELHLQRDEACEIGGVADPGSEPTARVGRSNGSPDAVEAPSAAPRARRPGSTRPMTASEVNEFLDLRSWGLLCTGDADGPYAVPVSYGFDGTDLFFATGPGRKATHLAANAAVCLTVPDVTDGARWRSVVVRGRAVPVTGLPAKLRAGSLVLRTRAGAGISATDLRRMRSATIYRIEPTEMSGRATG